MSPQGAREKFGVGTRLNNNRFDSKFVEPPLVISGLDLEAL